jgi:hypothetical protein
MVFDKKKEEEILLSGKIHGKVDCLQLLLSLVF